MREPPFKSCISLLLALLIVSCADSAEKAPEAISSTLLTEAELADYGHGIAVEDMRLLWRLREDSIDIKLAAPTTGWVAVGFNPETGETMKGANLIIGFVRAGKAEVVDHYGTMKDKHADDDKIGGQTDAGFAITGFYEDPFRDEEGDPLTKYMRAYFATRAVKLPGT